MLNMKFSMVGLSFIELSCTSIGHFRSKLPHKSTTNSKTLIADLIAPSSLGAVKRFIRNDQQIVTLGFSGISATDYACR